MNRVFKTKWSAAHQQYVVTDEHHATKGKAAKSAVAIAVAAFMMAAGAQAAYKDPNPNISSASVAEAQRAFETAEYQKDWGLAAMNASKAYALGFTGKDVAVGVMDSGALLQDHPDLKGDRFHAVKVENQSYGSSGNRYPQDSKNPGSYKPGDKVPASGQFELGMNDSHGTHVTGTVGGNRDGSEFHGVAFDADVYVGNTGGTDNTNYGPFQDPQFFYQGWSALATAISDANKFADNTTRGGFINNSFGTNIRVNRGEDVTSVGPDGGNTTTHFPTDTVSQTEYEYFLFMKDAKARKNSDSHWNGKSFVDAAYEAVQDKKVVQVFTTGNRDFAQPFYRPLYPYFNPDAEKFWIAVAGMKQNGSKYELESVFNEAGNAKWWTVAAPSRNIYSSKVDVNTGAPLWGNSSGTSMAAPHVTGALAVLMDRYDQMDALQVRDVMLTTASHTNPDGSKFEGWTAGEGQVDVRYGWGMPDLDKGMYGPGQFLGNFVYNMQGDSYDVWSNDISNEALKQRKAEDDAWLAAVTKWENEGCPDKLGDAFTEAEKELIGDLMLDSEFDVIGIEDQKIAKDKALEWRKTYYEKRKNAIAIRVYKGSLTKDGTGTLVMTGDNSYEGETKVEGGTLLAFAESIGTDNTVSVGAHGTFGVLSSYNDQFTKKGHLYSTDAQKGELKIEIAEGGTLAIDATSNVVVNSVNFKGNNKRFAITLEGADAGKLVEAWNDEKGTLTGSFKAEQTNDLFGEQAQDLTQNVESQYVFFELDKAEGKGNLATVSMKKKEGVTFEQFAGTANEQKIAAAIEASGNKLTGEILSAKTEQEISDTYRTLDDDFYATARNALVVNATAVSRTVMDQARGMGEGRSAEVDNGRARIWAAGIGHWGEAEGTKNTMDVDFRTGFLGAEALVLDNTKVGAFFGYGTTDYKSGLNKIDGEDKHFGVYGLTDIGNVTMTYGVAYTDEDRDTVRVMNTNVNQHSENASVLQGFVEGAYNFDLSVAKVSPYVGFTWARVETDAVVDNAIGHSFKTDEIKDDIQIATLGVRTAVPFAMGNMPVALTADLGWSHYFGDTEGLVNVQMGEGGKFAAIEGSELKDQANLGLGIVGQVAKHATVGVSYSGSWGSDINTHGIFANVRFNF